MKSFIANCFVFSIPILMLALSSTAIGKNYEDDVILTMKQKRMLDEFKNKVKDRLPKDYMKEDIYLIKWLRSADYKLEAAELNLMNNLRWRKEQKMDTIHEEDWSDMNDDFKYYLDGRDKFGRSFLFFDISTIDVRNAILRGKGERFNRYAVKGIDEACNLVRYLGNKYKNITRGHLVMNLDGYNIIQHGCLRCVPFLLRILLNYEEHYPECVDLIIAINTPASIEALLNSLRPLMSRDTREAMRIYGTNKSVWKAALSKLFDFDKLPPAIGGTQIYNGMEDY